MKQTRKIISPQKLRGGYYTPQVITDFISKWSIDENTKSILEPSCGDGNFIESATIRLQTLGIPREQIEETITGIELMEEEAVKAEERAENLGLERDIIINNDFFQYLKDSDDKTYDAIIGNPPFIRYQNFPEEHREIAMEMMKELGLKPNRLTNIWVPFLVISASILSENGKLGMVIPAELFQVKYAAETRVFLSEFFERITIFTFKKLVFEGTQQEVVLLLCEKSVNHGKGIRLLECDNLEDLDKINFEKINGTNVKPIDHSSEKWTKYYLNEDELLLMNNLKNDSRILYCKDFFKTEVGLVTGRNKFFMMTEEQVKEWNLEDFTVPVVSRSNQLKGVTFLGDDFEVNSNEQKSVHLFLPPDADFEDLPQVCKRYIQYGEEQGFHLGYKTRIRKRWYITPSTWIPDGFALRQVNLHPKIIINETNASSTDTIHRVKFKDNVDKKLAAVSFLNSLTFASSEVTGRSYGGGVMTFEPSEVGEIRIPDFNNLNLDFQKIDELVRNNNIEEVLDIVDEQLLMKHLGFSYHEVMKFRDIWWKLSQRRINRKK